MKSLYEELAEKEEALVLAAQFGKTLIEEKEELEKQIETMKREQQAQVESFEQESFQLKRLIETIRNEYENKLGDLNEDVQM
jgi:cell division protein FtsB